MITIYVVVYTPHSDAGEGTILLRAFSSREKAEDYSKLISESRSSDGVSWVESVELLMEAGE